MNYRFDYAVGFHPWEGLVEHPPFSRRSSCLTPKGGMRSWPWLLL
jgi:hypothetical protein